MKDSQLAQKIIITEAIKGTSFKEIIRKLKRRFGIAPSALAVATVINAVSQKREARGLPGIKLIT